MVLALTPDQRRTVWTRLWDMWAASVATGQSWTRQKFLQSTSRNLDKILTPDQLALVDEILRETP